MSMRVDSEIGDIKVFVYKARVVKAKKKKKTKKKQTKENKTAGNKNSAPERTRAPGPEHANAPEPTHAPEPANTISSNMTKKPGPELLFPELLLNERKNSIGLVHGIQYAMLSFLGLPISNSNLHSLDLERSSSQMIVQDHLWKQSPCQCQS